MVGDIISIGSPSEVGATYLWRQTAGPQPLAISDPRASQTTVTAVAPRTYELEIVAANTVGFAQRDRIVLSIRGAVTPAPTAPVQTATRTPTRTPTTTPSPTLTPGGPNVFGAVEYYANAAPVADIEVDVVDPADPGASPERAVRTDPDGRFAVADLPSGRWAVQPRANVSAAAVTALDATYVLQAITGGRSLSEPQRVACNASGNWALSALDASLILQQALGLRESLPAADACGSPWLFDPIPGGPGPTSARCRPALLLS